MTYKVTKLHDVLTSFPPPHTPHSTNWQLLSKNNLSLAQHRSNLFTYSYPALVFLHSNHFCAITITIAEGKEKKYYIPYFKLMTAVLHQFDTIFFFTPPRYVVPPSWLINMMHMSHIIPGFISSIQKHSSTNIRNLITFLYFISFIFWGG